MSSLAFIRYYLFLGMLVFPLCGNDYPTYRLPEILTTNNLKTLKVDLSKEICFGQTGFFSGHFKIYGDLIHHGITAYFNRVNESGGIHNKRLRLICAEDRGNAEIAAINIETFTKIHGIDCLLGVMGTRTLLKVLPLIEQKKVAMLFPWGGDAKLRSQSLAYLINGLGFMEPQIDKLIHHVVEELKLTKIGIFHSDSDFDIENAQYAKTLLERYKIQPIIIKDYNRFTMNLSHAANKMLEKDPRIVICLASSMPVVKLINNFLQAGSFGTKFLGIDSTLFVGEILKPKGVSYYYTSSMPDPFHSSLEIVQQYREDMKKYFPKEQPNILSLAYYIHAAIVCQALKQCARPLSKEKIMSALESMKKTTLGGFFIDFDPATRQAYPQTINLIKG